MKIYSSAFVLLFLPLAIEVANESTPLQHSAVATPQEHLLPLQAPTDAESMAFISSDAGNTWQETTAIPPAIAQQTAGNKQVQSAGVIIATGQRGIKRSTDNGAHWEWVISEGGVGIDVAKINGGFAAITFSTQSHTRRIRVSYDGGINWQPIDEALQPASTQRSINNLFTLAKQSYSASHPNNAPLPEEAMISSIIEVEGNFYCGHPKGVFKSADKGKTWQLLLPSKAGKVYTLSVLGKQIYAVPRDGGC